MDLRDTPLCNLCNRNPKNAVRYTWYASLLMVFILFMCACAAASYLDEKDNRGYGACGVLTVLSAIGLGIGGTIILMKKRNSYWMGMLMGGTIVFSNLMLIN